MKSNFLPFLGILIAIVVGFSIIKPKPIVDSFKQEYEADSFDHPVGKPDAEGYYNAQKFGENNHLGEDWNGVGGGNTDYGDSIFSVANGQVIFAEDIEGGWGNVIRIKHKFKGKYYESLYAHCSEISVNKGDWIKKGSFIGKIGDCGGMYLAHLHLELRDSLGMSIGGGYSGDRSGYLNPSEFINGN